MTLDPGHAPDREPPPPSIPDLDLVRRIGRGGFGEVWLGINRATGGLKAVKVVPLARGGRKVDPAGREVVSLAQFESQQIGRHPNLLDVQHVGRTDDVLFMLMDPADDVSGKPATNDAAYRPATLELRLEQGPLAADECLRCARQLVAGLAHLHAAGMVHRDVKPSNCLFVNRELKIADFGLLSPAVPQLSRLGTVRYMPPDGRMDLRADVYAAGLVIYEMLTGLPAEAFPRLGERAREIAADPRLAQLNRVALAAASRDHHARPTHAGELLTAVEAAAAASPRAAGRFRRRAAAAVLVAAVVPATLAISLLLASLSMSTMPARRDRPPEATAAVVPATAPVVNFITEPLGAAVLIDGTPYRDADGATSTTPVTLPVPAGGHRVTFQHPERGTLDAGRVNFDAIREVIARWP
ncbi:MAG: protein kinase domain-containing protein [Pirellulales bacterium]